MLWYGNLTFAYPRICPQCLKEQLFERKIWELAAFTVCPKHKSPLIDTCPKCGSRLLRRHPTVHLCKCGFDLRRTKCARAGSNLAALCSLIEQKARPNATLSYETKDIGLPKALDALNLEQLLYLIRKLGNHNTNGTFIKSPHRLKKVDPTLAQETVRSAAWILAEWPANFSRYCEARYQRSEQIAVTAPW
jgi:hypothetical protein